MKKGIGSIRPRAAGGRAPPTSSRSRRRTWRTTSGCSRPDGPDSLLHRRHLGLPLRARRATGVAPVGLRHPPALLGAARPIVLLLRRPGGDRGRARAARGHALPALLLRAHAPAPPPDDGRRAARRPRRALEPQLASAPARVPAAGRPHRRPAPGAPPAPRRRPLDGLARAGLRALHRRPRRLARAPGLRPDAVGPGGALRRARLVHPARDRLLGPDRRFAPAPLAPGLPRTSRLRRPRRRGELGPRGRARARPASALLVHRARPRLRAHRPAARGRDDVGTRFDPTRGLRLLRPVPVARRRRARAAASTPSPRTATAALSHSLGGSHRSPSDGGFTGA